MARTIGGISFAIMNGPLDQAGNSVETIERIGRDYSRFRKIGLRAQPRTIRTVDFGPATDLHTAEAAYKAAVGTTVTIVDAYGVSYSHCKVLQCFITDKPPCLSAGVPKVRLVAVWRVQLTAPTEVTGAS